MRQWRDVSTGAPASASKRQVVLGAVKASCRLELGDTVEVAVGVLEPGHPVVAQFGNPLLVRLDPIAVDLLKADAVGGEFVDRPLEVLHLPGGDRAARL